MNRTLLLALVLLALAVPARAQTNLLVNGSFEDGDFAGDANGFMSLSDGSTIMTGWTTFNAELAWGRTSNSIALVPSDGTHVLDLTGYHDAPPYGGVEQTVALAPGQVYRLTFDLGTQQSDPYSLGPVAVVLQGNGIGEGLRFTFTPYGSNTQWATFGQNFTAPSGGSVTFSLRGDSTAGGNFIGLDNVRLVAVPANRTRIVARTRATWVTGGSSQFGALPNAPSLSALGVAFYGTGAGGQQGIYEFAPPTQQNPPSPTRVADLATPIPKGIGPFTAFSPIALPPNPQISDSNVVFYGEGSSGQRGIYGLIAGQLVRVADTSTVIPGRADTFTEFNPPSPMRPPRPMISGENVAFFGAGVATSCIVARVSGSLMKVADTDTSIPDGTDLFAGFMTAPQINGSNVVFIGSGPSSQQGVYVGTPASLTPAPYKVADKNTAIPGGVGNFTGFMAVGVPPSSASDMPLKVMPLKVAFAGMGASGQQGVYVCQDVNPLKKASPMKVADLTTAIPGGSETFAGFGALSTGDSGVAALATRSGTETFTGFGALSIGDSGVAFIGMDSASQTGLYVTVGGLLKKIVAVGDMVDGQVVTDLMLGPGGFVGNALSYQASLSDGSQELIVVNVPPFELQITAAEQAGNDLRLSFTSDFASNYVVQSCTDFPPVAAWTNPPGTNTGTGFILQSTVSNAFTVPGQFYRIQQLP